MRDGFIKFGMGDIFCQLDRFLVSQTTKKIVPNNCKFCLLYDVLSRTKEVRKLINEFKYVL
jgi:hypothetical protein